MPIVDSGNATFDRLMEQLNSGDPRALATLYSEYSGVVREAVRRRLPERLRKEYDSIDFAHDVWASLCRVPPGGHRFAAPADLSGFLVRIARNKVIDVCRRKLTTKAYDVNREQPLVRAEDGAEVPLATRQASPSQWAVAAERWDTIAATLPAAHVAIIERLWEGYTQQEVAAMAGVSDRTVRRIVDRVRELCEERT